MKRHYDVIVIGGGTSGVVAAIQAAREGVSTLLVEKTEMLGGTLTNALVAYPGLFYAWTKQIIAGIGWELVEKTVREAGMSMPDFSKQSKGEGHHKWQVSMNPYIYAMICDEETVKSGADILFDAMCAKIEETDGMKSVTLCTKEGLKTVASSVVIDCTGDASAAALAGYAVERSAEPQPATYGCRVDGYDMDAVDFDRMAADFAEEVSRGVMKYTDSGWDTKRMSRQWLNDRGGNGQHTHPDGADAATSEGRTAFALEGRAALLRMLRFCRKYPGLEKMRLTALAPECGIRETVRIKGKKTVTQDMYLSGARYGDDVCFAYYPIDLHSVSGSGLNKTYLAEPIVPTIPRGALLPAGSRNFLVAGRCIASDRPANSAVRVQAPCMAEAQAAAALAVLAVRTGVDVEDVPMDALYDLLEKHGAIVPR